MQMVAATMCGLIFGWGLLISEMTQPSKVIGFLDVFGTWDPSLGVVMAAALAVSSIGFRYAASRVCPVLVPKSLWPNRTEIDPPLVIGAMLFGIGWGLVGLCPGPALENLATLSPRVIGFVVAMAFGMVLHRIWQKRGAGPERLHAPTAVLIDG
jgi:uncharacterized protein